MKKMGAVGSGGGDPKKKVAISARQRQFTCAGHHRGLWRDEEQVDLRPRIRVRRGQESGEGPLVACEVSAPGLEACGVPFG